MPMPVKPKEMTIEFLENGKWKAWEKDRKNCYAAGKADALPPWPPPYKPFKFKSGVVGGLTVMWRIPEFDRFSDKPCWCSPTNLSDGISVTWEKVSSNQFRGDDVTAAYFRGELEEV